MVSLAFYVCSLVLLRSRQCEQLKCAKMNIKQCLVVVAVSLNGSLSSATGDGRVVVWGNSSVTNIPSSVSRDIVAISSGDTHCLALRNDGKVVVWDGLEARPELRALNNPSYVACDVGAVPKRFCVGIAAGNSFSLALDLTGEVSAWGCNSVGQCDVPVEAKSQVISIHIGTSNCLALRLDGLICEWGWPRTLPDRLFRPPGEIVSVAAGQGFTLLLTREGKVLRYGLAPLTIAGCQRGSPCEPIPVSVPVGASSEVVSISAGGLYAAALKSDGTWIDFGPWSMIGSYKRMSALSVGKILGRRGSELTAQNYLVGVNMLGGADLFVAPRAFALDSDYPGLQPPAVVQAGVTAVSAGPDAVMALIGVATPVLSAVEADSKVFLVCSSSIGLDQIESKSSLRSDEPWRPFKSVGSYAAGMFRVVRLVTGDDSRLYRIRSP